MKYTVEVIPLCTYLVWFVIVIVAPYVRSVGHVFAYPYTRDDDSEHPMEYETSLHPTFFPTFFPYVFPYVFPLWWF